MVGLVGRCANLRHPEKSLAELRRLAELAAKAPLDAVPIYEPRDVRRRLGAEQIEQLIAAYRAGEHASALAVGYGISKASVFTLLETQGIALRRRRMAGDEIDEAVRLYQSGLTLRQVGKQLGRSHDQVREVLEGRGIPRRASGRKGSVARPRIVPDR